MQGDEDTEGSQDDLAARKKLPGMLSVAMLACTHIACLLRACCRHVRRDHATDSQ